MESKDLQMLGTSLYVLFVPTGSHRLKRELAVASSEYLMILFKTGFFAVTLFELCSLFILINNPFRYLWLAVMIPFHLLSLLTMNIFFWENLVLIVVLFLIVGRR